MNPDSRITRRSVLRGLGTAIVLPLLDSLRPGPALAREKEPAKAPARMICVYTPHGVRNSRWYPGETGFEYSLPPTLEPLASVRSEVSVLTGLCHPRRAATGAPAAAGRWLTGVHEGDRILVDFASPNQSLSMDQLAAEKVGGETRWRSLQLSTEAGAGVPGRSKTLSFNARGLPLPAMNKPRAVFNRLFVPDTAKDRAAERERYERHKSLLDNVLAESKAMKRRLGEEDRRRLDAYLESLREVERQLDRNQRWLDRPKPKVDAAELAFEFQNRRGFIEILYDLIFLALRTDSTRIVTFMTGVEVDAYKWGEVGVNHTYHGLQHHSGDRSKLEGLAKVDRLEVGLLARFLERLHETEEAGTRLLDHTMVLYGSGMNNGVGLEDGKGQHSTRKLPILLAGGRNLGIRQGQHLRYENDQTPLCNLHVTMLQLMGLETERFVDGTGTLSGLV